MPFLIYVEDDTSIAVPDDVGLEHRAYIDGRRDMIKAGGPLLEDGTGAINGRVFFTTYATRQEAEDFINNEPFVLLGRAKPKLIREMIVRIPADA